MARVVPLPPRGELFDDPRGEGRALRVSWHQEASLVVLSLWREGTCTATFRLPVADVPRLVNALVEGLAAGADRATDSEPGAVRPLR